MKNTINEIRRITWMIVALAIVLVIILTLLIIPVL